MATVWIQWTALSWPSPSLRTTSSPPRRPETSRPFRRPASWRRRCLGRRRSMPGLRRCPDVCRSPRPDERPAQAAEQVPGRGLEMSRSQERCRRSFRNLYRKLSAAFRKENCVKIIPKNKLKPEFNLYLVQKVKKANTKTNQLEIYACPVLEILGSIEI